MQANDEFNKVAYQEVLEYMDWCWSWWDSNLFRTLCNKKKEASREPEKNGEN